MRRSFCSCSTISKFGFLSIVSGTDKISLAIVNNKAPPTKDHLQVKLPLIIALLLFTGCADAQPTAADVEYVYDGDTITVILPQATTSIRIRLMGFDTAERKSPKCQAEASLADKQRQALIGLIGNTVYLDIKGQDGYGRTLAWAYTADGRPVSDVMIKDHGARPYSGGRRQTWCS